MPRLAVLVAALALLGSAAGAAERVTVFAAASLKTAMDGIAEAWRAEGGEVAVSLAGSSALARQILAGAPAEVFVSANPGWMDAVAAEGLVVEGSRRDLLTNAIVLVAHGAAEAAGEIGPEFDLAARLGDGRLAMALVEAVPAGIYGRAALESLGLWEAAAPRVVQASDVRAALALVAAGEAPYGIVYATDAAAEPGVSVVGTFPAGSHPPVIYPAALIEGAGPEAARFLDFLSGPAARALFAAQGFGAP
jgi:molybdate transport system substrate-binding protein